MGKKLRPKQSKPTDFNDPSSGMMTEQQERMYYSTKKRLDEPSNALKKDSRPNQHQPDEDAEDIDPIEISNLNQTSAQEITEFINKLIAKNKVTSKNAFDIPLIHLEQMEDFRASLNENTWKRLSSTLENDYKIYGYRVDAAHTITYKMVESIARHEAANQETTALNILQRISPTEKSSIKSTPGGDLLTSFIDNSFSEGISKNKLNVDYTKYIEKNQKLLNVTHVESFFGCNPGLEKTKRKFDQQGLKALLLNNIELRDGCQLKLDEHRKSDSDQNQAKQQHEQKDHHQTEMIFESQITSYYSKIFDQSKENFSIASNTEERNIFDQIYELNIHEGNANKDDYLKYQKLYRIISGEGKQDKKAAIQQNELQIQAENAGNQNETDQAQMSNKGGQDILQKRNDENPNLNQDQVNDCELPTNPCDILKNESQIVSESLNQLQNIEQSQVINPQVSQQQKTIQNQIIPQNHLDQEQNHVLKDKNFQMHQLNLDNLDQSVSEQHPAQKIQYLGKLKNIQEYIKIKQPQQKNKKKKLQLGLLNSEEIEKKLFNRKTNKRKIDLNKESNNLKEQDSISSRPIKRINFNKIANDNTYLKRSVVFKKSAAQERLYTQARERIQKRLDQQKHDDSDTENDRKKKGKRNFKVFDLPVYQFQKGDINLCNPFEQMDPQTNDLQFSTLYKQHFPSFVFSAKEIQESFIKKRHLKQKQLEEQRKIDQNDSQNILIEGNNALKSELVQNVNDRNSQPILEEENHPSHEDEPDISFIQDEIGQGKQNHQVAIREAKQTVKAILLKLFQSSSKKKRISKSKNTAKISFKQVYEAYYRRQGYISPALCFLTVLHLTNQHNLILQGKEDGTDFKIFVGQENKMGENISLDNLENQILTDQNDTLLDPDISFVSRVENEQYSQQGIQEE